MKIIKRGKNPKHNHDYNGRCSSCGLEALFLLNEIEFVADRGQDWATATCPTPGCGQVIWCQFTPEVRKKK